MTELDFSALVGCPHVQHIQHMSERAWRNPEVVAVWIGGSLAAGRGDALSDIDFRVAVSRSALHNWTDPEWEEYLRLPVRGGILRRFGDDALLHHLVIDDGTIIDYFVQDTARATPEPAIKIIGCRDDVFLQALKRFGSPVTPIVRDIDPDEASAFLVDYWITTHKQIKGLAREHAMFSFVGLYHERIALLRAWYMVQTGKDVVGRITIHLLAHLHRGLSGRIGERELDLLGAPSRSPEETIRVIEAIRDEISMAGRILAQKYGFAYPAELERVVRDTWKLHIQALHPT